MEDKKKRTQIAFDINVEIRKKIKILAAKRNITMNNWIMRAISERIIKETKYEEDKDES